MLPSASRPGLPAVVDVDVGPAVFDQAAGNHRVGGSAHVIPRGNVAVKMVPTVPAQRRGQADRVADDEFARGPVNAAGVRGGELNGIFARGGNGAGDVARPGVERQPRGQAGRGERDGPFTGHGQVVEKRVAGPRPINTRAVDLRRRGGGGRRADLRHRREIAGGQPGGGKQREADGQGGDQRWGRMGKDGTAASGVKALIGRLTGGSVHPTNPPPPRSILRTKSSNGASVRARR